MILFDMGIPICYAYHRSSNYCFNFQKMNYLKRYSTDEKIVAGAFVTMMIIIMILMHFVDVLLKISVACRA